MYKNIEKKKLDTKSLVVCSLFAALVCVGAFIKIPIGVVPVTVQWFFVAMSGIVLGSKLGFTSVGVYLLLGLAGIPVFTKGGGITYIFQPTFGYLIGFAIAAFVIGYITENREKTFLNFAIANLTGLVIVYAVGFVYLYIVMTKVLGKTDIVLFNLFKAGVLVFVPTDVIWALIAAYIGLRVTKAIKK